VEGFRRAEALLPDPGFQGRCRHERRLVSLWLTRPAGSQEPVRPGPGRHWSEQLRAATVALPAAAASPLPQTLDDHLAAGIIRLLDGDARGATADLRAVCEGARSHSVEWVVAILADAVAGLLTGERGASRLEQAALEAELADQPWLERLTRAALDTVLPSPAEEGGSADSRAADQARSEGDDWGAALLLLLQGAWRVLGDGEDGAEVLDRAAGQFCDLHAPVLAVWARALRAVALARRGVP
jgi:hypothetical protein